MTDFDINPTMRLIGYQIAVYADDNDETRQIREVLMATGERMTMTMLYLYTLGKIHGIRKERRKR